MISCIIWCCWMTWFLCVFVVGMVSFPYICLVCLLWFVKKLCMLVHCMIWPWYLLLCRLCWLSWPLLQGHAIGWIGDLVWSSVLLDSIHVICCPSISCVPGFFSAVHFSASCLLYFLWVSTLLKCLTIGWTCSDL